jgi:Xaa-Pro aminopeptidase
MPTENSRPTSTRSRVSRLREKMCGLDLDTFLVLIEANRRYLSGYTGEDGQFDETAGVLLITHEHCILATDSRYDLQVRQEAPAYEIVCYRKSIYDELPRLFTRVNARRVGFESARLTVKHHQDLMRQLDKARTPVTMVPTENQVESLRLAKDADELAITQRAVQCAETAFQRLIEWMRPGLTERDVARQLEEFMRAGGAEGASFPIIVAAGPNSAKPHAVPGLRPIGIGEPILLDWGARIDGYCSDISRTVIFGPVDAQFKKIYAIVREAQAAAIAVIQPGAQGRAVDTVARRVIEQAGFGSNFGHGLGHGTGLCIHEAPRLSPHSEDTLAAGMIVTVEPGIYLPEWGGIRLENQVVVTQNGAAILNSLDLDDHHLAFTQGSRKN